MLIVLDTNVPAHVAATRVVVIGFQETRWGPKKGRLRRLRQESEWLHTTTGLLAEEVPYAVGLALAKNVAKIRFAINGLIGFERWKIRPAFDQAGRDIWTLFGPEKLDTSFPESFVIMGGGVDFNQTLRMLSRSPDDTRLRDLLEILGEKSSQDAFNLWNAECHHASFLMTIDRKFVRRCEQKSHQINSSVSVSLPSAIAKKLEIPPAPSDWFAQRPEIGLDEWLEPDDADSA